VVQRGVPVLPGVRRGPRSGMWHVACGVWPLASGMWRVASGMWRVASERGAAANYRFLYASGRFPESFFSLRAKNLRERPRIPIEAHRAS
jgi:hypothetical protein